MQIKKSKSLYQRRRRSVWFMVLGVFWLCSPNIFATESEGLLLTQRFLEERVLKIAHGYDKNALVFVDLSSSSKNIALPAVPFVFDVNGLKSKGEAIADHASITIFSGSTKLSDEAQDLIRKLIKPYTKNLSMKIVPFPKGYEVAVLGEVTTAQDKPETPHWNDLWEALQTSSLMGGFATAKTNLIWWGLIGAIILGVVVCFFIFGLWRHLGKIGSMQSVIELGLGKVASALENSDGSGSSRSLPSENRPTATSSSKSGAGEEESDSLATFPDESLLALLSDCYWTKDDEYGAFLWQHIPVVARKRLIDTAPYLGVYASHLGQLSGVNKGFASDPYYLTPLHVHHLSNEALSKLVKTHSNLYRALPELRSLGLGLPLKDRLAFEEQRVSNTTSEMKTIQELNVMLKQIIPSALRPLRTVKSLPITSTADEQELLSWAMPSAEIMAATPSLVWAMHLPDDVLAEIVTAVSAKELAGALVGPESVLSKITSLLQPKRRELIENYMKRMKPQRESNAFFRLHHNIVEALKVQTATSDVNLTVVGEDSHDRSA
jgi:hypothetical protein